MSKLTVDRHKNKYLRRDELLQLSKEDLADTIIQLQSHTVQLKNIILRNNHQKKTGKTKKRKRDRDFDFSKCETRRILLRVAYLGVRYNGLAVQEDSSETIEAYLFSALIKSCLIQCREKSTYHRCGRTDKGVSGSGQVISIDVRSRLTAEQLSTKDSCRSEELDYCKMLNRLLPEDIRAIAWLPIPPVPETEDKSIEPYSARFDCKRRTYKYWFPRGCLNLQAMSEACRHLKGSHDFRNLCKMDVANGVTSYYRYIHSASVVSVGNELNDKGYSMHYLQVTANAFLWHQIRCMAGLLFLVGSGSESPNIIKELLDVEANPRKPQYNMAVEAPLNLFHCAYEILEDFELKDDPEIPINKPIKNVQITAINEITTENHVSNDQNVNINLHDKQLNSSNMQNGTINENTDSSQFSKCNKISHLENNSPSTNCSNRNQHVLNDGNNSQIDMDYSKEKEAPYVETKVNKLKRKKMDDSDEDIESIVKKEVPGNAINSFSAADRIANESEGIMSLSDYTERATANVFDPNKVDWWFVDLEELTAIIKCFQSQWSRTAIQASMIRDIVEELEALYNKEIDNRLRNSTPVPPETSDGCIRRNGDTIEFLLQSECLLQGVKAKIYQPLLTRNTCESLENRIEHYIKKKRLKKPTGEESEFVTDMAL